MDIAIISHQDCLLHDMGAGHPESPERIRAIEKVLLDSEIAQSLHHYKAKEATKEDLKRVHSENHIDFIFKQASKNGNVIIDPDTIMNQYTLRAALLAAGAVKQGIDFVMNMNTNEDTNANINLDININVNQENPKKDKNPKNKENLEKEVFYNKAFCNVRPPGHHAEKNRAMGFCFFNNIAVGAAYALDFYKLKRIAIIDFDVHHGNGTEDIFKNDARILYCSSFQYPFYPGNIQVKQKPPILDIPLPSGAGSIEFREQVQKLWIPALSEFKPELILISAGFDAHQKDPLAGLNFTEEDYYWITREIVEIANNSCQGRIVSSLEGGYNLSVLGQCVLAHLKAFLS